ncbi:chromosome segregation protein SMC [Ketobacter sp. MCCC 1A13808]|uniref:chromosome segregation protein SMC n=1 Tax=Ketobacter sp. MCCC 1A13808 TaxID=2602738 RepID=UPI0012EC223C|nr:chromosome segregation protein SMC [Ketobacter sp. MCCC 1A13808]MVF10875.1 chromosome segregation protein SMC [Ketobacter sp. MCCC 1A13808]
MRLKSIKLAGFKSFVDPTTVSFPDNLTSIVGPNGCGKSNVIDAVRWVMGESSAKHLRGESMADVIFNGSSSRKPTTQASVELVFDNSDNSLGGEYVSFNEIGIKRLVTRDGQSNYYLNGTKCRRKDITDIFLGTGLGARSYAIIEQGMISRLIEAKPEELRVFIEEAAGISKYKERRKETEHRMRRTRENLDRLEDLRDELGRQLQHLERQAAAAEKYKQFKEEERLVKAQLQALKWKSLNDQVENSESTIRDLEVKLEAFMADQRSMDATIEQQREQHHELSDKLNEVQGRFYGLGADIARVEQTIQHTKERGNQLRQDLQQTIEACRQGEDQQRIDQEQLEEANIQLAEIEPEYELVKAEADAANDNLHNAEEKMQDWQHKWDEFNQKANEPRQRAQVEQSRIQHLEQSVERLRDRIERLKGERETLSAGPLEEEVAMLEERMAEADMKIEDMQGSALTIQETMKSRRESNNQINLELDNAKSELQTLKGRHASLEALQQAAMGESDLVEWLTRHQLNEQPRLAQKVQAESGWEKAVETVLGDYLQAVCINGLDAVTAVVSGLEKGVVSFLETGTEPNQICNQTLVPLSGKLQGEAAAKALTAGVYIAEDLAQALQLRSQLNAGESLITPDSIWIGPNWMRVARDSSQEDSVLKRQKVLEDTNLRLEEVEARVEQLTETLTEGREALRAMEERREESQRELSEFNRSLSDLKAQLSAKQVRLEQFNMRRERISKELEECKEQQTLEQEALGEARLVLQDAMDLMATDTDQREQLLKQRDENRARLDQVKQAARGGKDKAHQLALQVQQLQSRRDSVKQGLARLTQQLTTLQERRSAIEEQLSLGDDPFVELQAELEEKLESRLLVEEELATARRTQEDCDHQLRAAEKKRAEAEQSAQGVRSQLERNRMEWQGMRVQRENLQNQLTESQFDIEVVVNELPEAANEAEWSAELDRLGGKISRLGAINLAAIDEYKSQSERKNYLDSQHEDLMQALETLENAIRKIDRETRTRFKETFDKVSAGLSELFPKVFGGGHAYLELTGDDLLDTGVAIMARPPGKKNSTIYLLSGGEKALTAIALVFSIFQLNPAPFCILDEVDAPLDDANVGRYSRMVEEMSAKVQFIYITHNKIAMEMAHQLMGVTMHEPGVSRLVTVDVEQAAAMAVA